MRRSLFLFIIILPLIVSCNRGEQQPFSFVQLCDPQLGMGGYEHDKATLRQAVIQVNELDCDFVVICGDLVNHANDSSFADFLGITSGFEIPCYLVAGNHDVGNIPNDTTLGFYRETIGEDYYTFGFGGYSFVVTNTQLWKTHIGEESDLHDEWFSEVMSEANGRKSKGKEKRSRANGRQAPVIVIGHHPLFVENAFEEEAYFNIPPIKRMELLDFFTEKEVVAYLSGHKHELLLNNYGGIQLVTGETTSKHFDERPLGFRLWEVDKDTVMHHFVPLNIKPIN